MSVNVRESMRDWEKGKGREGKGEGRRKEGTEQQWLWQHWGWQGPGLVLTELQQLNARPLQSLPLLPGWVGWARAWQAALCHHETAVSYPWSLFSHSHSRCEQPTQQTRDVNSKLSNQAWRHRDNAAPLNSFHILWHLRRRNHKERIEICTFHLYSLASTPCLWTDHPTPSGLGLYADGEGWLL